MLLCVDSDHNYLVPGHVAASPFCLLARRVPYPTTPPKKLVHLSLRSWTLAYGTVEMCSNKKGPMAFYHLYFCFERGRYLPYDQEPRILSTYPRRLPLPRFCIMYLTSKILPQPKQVLLPVNTRHHNPTNEQPSTTGIDITSPSTHEKGSQHHQTHHQKLRISSDKNKKQHATNTPAQRPEQEEQLITKEITGNKPSRVGFPEALKSQTTSRLASCPNHPDAAIPRPNQGKRSNRVRK